MGRDWVMSSVLKNFIKMLLRFDIFIKYFIAGSLEGEVSWEG